MENISLGKNGKLGKLNLSRIKAGVTKEDVAKIDKNLDSVFDKIDVNKDGTLDRTEIDTLKEQVTAWAGVDENLEKNEINDERFASKKDKKALLNLLSTLENVTPEDVVKAETQTIDGQTVEVVTFKDNHTETFFPDGKTVSKSETENKKSEITKQNGVFVSEVVTENEGQENEIISTTTMQNGQKQTVIDNKGDKTTKTITYNGEKKDKAVVVGETSTSVITYGEDEKPATEVETSGTTEKTYTYNGDEKVLTTEVHNKGIAGKEIRKTYNEDGGYTQTQNVGSGVITTVADKDGNVTDCKKTETINGQEVSLQLDNDGNIPGVIVQNGESLSVIAKKFGCSVDDLVTLNQDQLKGKGKNKYFDVGAEIKLPNTVGIEKFQKAQEGRKPAEVAKAEYARDAEIRRQKAEAEKQEREYYQQLGVINFDDKGKKVKADGWGDREFEVIGGVGYGRQLVQYNGKLYTRSHDGKILREDYLEAHKAYVSKSQSERNNTVSGQEGVTYVKDSNGKVWYFDEKTGKAIVKDGYNKIVKQESAFIANQLHTAAKDMGTDNELLAQGVNNIYSADILAGVNKELRTKDSDYDVDVQTSQMMPVEALILDENNHKSARPLLQTLIDSGAMSVEEQARTIKREMEYELAGDGKVGVDLGRALQHFEFGTSYTSTADLNNIMQMATSREVRLEIENQYKNDPQFANLEPNEGSYVRTRIGIDGGLMNWNAQEVDQFDANWIKSGAYAEATYDSEGNLIDAGDQEHRNAVVDRLVFGYQNKEALNKGLEVINDDPYSVDYIYLEIRAGEEVAKDPDGKYQARFTEQDNIQRYLAGFHSDETGRVDSGNVSASNTCLFKGVKPPRIQAEEALYDANNGDYSKTFDSMDEETYLAMAELVANGDVAGVEDMNDLYNKAYNGTQTVNDKIKIKANAMLSGQVEFSDDEKVDFCLKLMHKIDENRGRGGSTGSSASYTNSADYQTEQLKAILQNNPQIMSSVRGRVEQEDFSYTTTLQSGGGPSGPATVTNLTTDTKNSYIQLLEDTKNIVSEEVFFDAEGNQITDPNQIQAIKTANMQALAEMRKYVAELEREFKKGVDAEGWLSDAANGLSEFSGIGTDREDVATEYRNAKLMLSQFEAAAQGRLRDSQGYVISAQDLAQQMLDKQNSLAETNSDYKQTIAYGKMGIVLAPVIVATGGAGAAIGLVGGGTVAVAVGSGIAAGATTYGINALEYNTSYTGNTAEAREQNLQDSLVNGATTAIGIAQMKYIGGMANNLGTVGRTSVRLGTTVAADTTVGVAAEGITTGDVSAEGLVSNMIMSGVGNAIGAKSLGKKQVKTNHHGYIDNNNPSATAEQVNASIHQEHVQSDKHAGYIRKRQQEADKLAVDMSETPITEAELKAYRKEYEFKPVSDEDMPAYKAHQEQVQTDYADAHRIENNAKIVKQKKSMPVATDNANVQAIENEIKSLDGQIAILKKKIFGAKKMGKKTAELEKQLQNLEAKRSTKSAELDAVKNPVDAVAEVKPSEDAEVKQPVEEKPAVETPSVESKEVINDINPSNPNSVPGQKPAQAVEVPINSMRQPTPQERMEMGQIGNNINRAKTPQDIANAQQWLNKMPAYPQKERLQAQLNAKSAEIKTGKVSNNVEIEKQRVAARNDKIKELESKYKTSQGRININGKPVDVTIYNGSQQGSNPGCWLKDNSTGELYYYKANSNNPINLSNNLQERDKINIELLKKERTQARNASEVLAAELYDLAGVNGPELSVMRGHNNECIGVISKFENYAKISSSESLSSIREGFAADCWLANWDALKEGNVLMSNGEAVRADVGGSLCFRARGGRKTSFRENVEELTSFFKEGSLSKKYVEGMSHEELLNSLSHVTGISDKQISDLVDKFTGAKTSRAEGTIGYTYSGGIQNPQYLKETLIARRDYMARFEAICKQNPMKSGETMADYMTRMTDITPKTEYSLDFDSEYMNLSERVQSSKGLESYGQTTEVGHKLGEHLTPSQKRLLDNSYNAYNSSKSKRFKFNDVTSQLTTDHMVHSTSLEFLEGILSNGLLSREFHGNSTAAYGNTGIKPGTRTPMCADLFDVQQNSDIANYLNTRTRANGEGNFISKDCPLIIFNKKAVDPVIMNNSFMVSKANSSVLHQDGNMSGYSYYDSHRAVPVGLPANAIEKIVLPSGADISKYKQIIIDNKLTAKIFDDNGNLLFNPSARKFFF